MVDTSDHQPAALPKVTVLTPTYNRRGLLGRVYESLRRQTFTDFEWVIVDDGSTDGTRAAVTEWQRCSPFTIAYVCQPNSGKHAALNRGVERARAEFCAVIDSDDWYMPDALRTLMRHWEAIPAEQRASFANVEACCALLDGTRLGSVRPVPVLDSDMFTARYVHGIREDTVGMYRTAVLRQFPFPEDLGRFVPEDLVWNRIARTYRTRFVDQVLLRKQYLPDGLSAATIRSRVAASPAYAVYMDEILSMSGPLPIVARLRYRASWVRYMLHQRISLREQYRRAHSRLAWAMVAPVGVGLYLRDRWGLRGG